MSSDLRLAAARGEELSAHATQIKVVSIWPTYMTGAEVCVFALRLWSLHGPWLMLTNASTMMTTMAIKATLPPR
jgi:hypothetical protein